MAKPPPNITDRALNLVQALDLWEASAARLLAYAGSRRGAGRLVAEVGHFRRATAVPVSADPAQALLDLLVRLRATGALTGADITEIVNRAAEVAPRPAV